MSTSKTKCTPNSSKDLKIYKRPLQNISKYFVALSGSNGKPKMKLTDSSMLRDTSKGTLFLHESPSSSGPNSSGVFKVTAKPTIDISQNGSYINLLNDDLLINELRPPKLKEELKETAPDNVCKRTNDESSEGLPVKKKNKLLEKAKQSTQQSSDSKDFTFEYSEDEDEKKVHHFNGDKESPNVIFCCLECPEEFLSIADLKKHYTENHPEAPNLFINGFHQVFKCFVCPFTTNTLKALKEHYEEKHPENKVDNSLMYSKHSRGRCQEESSQCEKVGSPERPGGIFPESTHIPSDDVKNAHQHSTSKDEDVALYYCKKCKFCHTSVVVLQVHYQKNHPDEALTIDKIKQSAHVTSHTTSQMIPDKSPDAVTMIEQSTPQKNITDPSKGLSLTNLKHAPEAFKTYSEYSLKTKEVESAGDRRKGQNSPSKRNSEMSTGVCSLSGGSPQTSVQEIICYSAEMQKKKLQSEAETSTSMSPSSVKTSKQVEVCSEEDPKEDEDDADAYACAENLFYCQLCNYGNPTSRGVWSHQNKIHKRISSSRECIIEYSSLVRDKIKKSKSQAKELSFASDLPLPIMNESDKNVFFCYFCNYRQSTVGHVMRHCYKKHNRFVIKTKYIRQYTAMVIRQTQMSSPKTTENQEDNCVSLREVRIKKKNTEKLGKEQRTLQCHKCPYNTEYVYLLRRHLCKTHKVKPSLPDVLRECYEQGTLQTGYHCDLCVFSHQKASAVHEHYQQQHPGSKRSLKNITTRLYVGPQTSPPKKRKPHIRHSDGVCDDEGIDGSLTSQRCEQNKTKLYPCRACTFKGTSMSSITLHYRAVHPWSVKEDGSVLDVINTKRPSANKQVEDHNETSGSFDTYQVPLEFDDSPGTFHEATISSTLIKCSYCSAMFNTQRGLNTHCGIKHRDAIDEYSNELTQEQVQIQTSMHVFKCPHCTYINTSYQGVLSHCQWKHPALSSRADSLHMDDAYLQNAGNCLNTEGSSSKLSGYMCKTCPQIYATQEKLNEHCQRLHIGTVANTRQPSPKLSAVSKKKQSMTHKSHGTVSKASLLNKKRYTVVRCQHCAYSCSTQIALDRHLRVHHKNASISKARENLFRCALCSNAYYRKKRLGNHYAEKHGKESFLKYFAPLYMQVHKKPAPISLDCPLTQQQVNTSQACESSTVTKKNIRLVYKCPSCPYVNVSHHGTLTHCQMRHPALLVRTDKLQTDEILVTHMDRCKIGKSSNGGYMCIKCPQMYESWTKLKIHCNKDHGQAEATASEHSDETETEEQPDHSSQSSELEALSVQDETSALTTTDIGSSLQLSTREKFQSNTPSGQDKASLYKCNLCTYSGWCRKYLYCHYKNTHKLDVFTIYKLLEKYNKYKLNRASKQPEAESEKKAPVKCKMCPNLTFDSSQLLIAHYSTFHRADSILDFIVLSKGSKRSTGLYNCAHCMKQMNGIRKLCLHLDRHREREKMKAKDAETKASVVITTPEAKSIKLCRQDELPMFESVEELIQWNMTPVETFTLPPSPQSSPSKPTDVERAGLELREYKHTCKQCNRTFMSLKGLLLHERSHAALAAIKKLDNLPTSSSKQAINKYVIYKIGTVKPFLCSFCSYRTTVMGLWRRHFIKKHQQDVLLDPAETDNQDKECALTADEEPPNSSEELNSLPEYDKEPEITKKSLYLEPPDVQRQLKQFSLMAQAGAPTKATVQETKLPENSLLHCEVCTFNTGHLSSMRRHYLNRHGKKILRCKDCNFFTGFRKTLKMHMETGHSTCQSEATHQKDLCCPFCLYQTKNKNNMIDHIVLHRDERFVPIEVCRPKLSRYLQGIVFRCHKCTFTSGSAENLRLHMMKHDDIKPYKCRLCYFDCTQLNDLEAHLSDKHQVERNHELVGQVSLDQLEARVCSILEEEPLLNLEHHNDSEDVKTEFVIDCNKSPHERSAESPAENNIREKIKLQLNEVHRKQRQDDQSCVPDLQKPNSRVQENHEQDPQEQAGIVFLPDTVRRQGRENIVGQHFGDGNNAHIQFEDSNGPKKQRQTNENQAQTKLRDGEDSSITFTQQKEEAAEGSSTTYGKIAERAQAHKLQIKALQHRALNIEAMEEEDIRSYSLQLDEDGSNCKTHKKAKHDKMIKMEQNVEMILDEEGSITLAHNLKNLVNIEASSAFAKKTNLRENNIMAQESFTLKRNLLTLMANCAPPKMSQKERLSVSFIHCKEERVHNQKKGEEARDTYGEMPVLENEYLKEKHPVGRGKEEDQNDHLKQKQDKEEMITEDDENRCANQEHEELDGIKEAANPNVPMGALTVMDGAAEVLCPATAEEKLFPCEFCGRNLMNSSELERHVTRHGI